MTPEEGPPGASHQGAKIPVKNLRWEKVGNCVDRLTDLEVL